MALIPTCRDMSEFVTDYLEHDLPWGAWLAARWHLVLCPACRNYYEQMRETIRLLGGGRLPPDPTAESEVLARLRDASPPQASPPLG